MRPKKTKDLPAELRPYAWLFDLGVTESSLEEGFAKIREAVPQMARTRDFESLRSNLQEWAEKAFRGYVLFYEALPKGRRPTEFLKRNEARAAGTAPGYLAVCHSFAREALRALRSQPGAEAMREKEAAARFGRFRVPEEYLDPDDNAALLDRHRERCEECAAIYREQPDDGDIREEEKENRLLGDGKVFFRYPIGDGIVGLWPQEIVAMMIDDAKRIARDQDCEALLLRVQALCRKLLARIRYFRALSEEAAKTRFAGDTENLRRVLIEQGALLCVLVSLLAEGKMPQSKEIAFYREDIDALRAEGREGGDEELLEAIKEEGRREAEEARKPRPIGRVLRYWAYYFAGAVAVCLVNTGLAKAEEGRTFWALFVGLPFFWMSMWLFKQSMQDDPLIVLKPAGRKFWKSTYRWAVYVGSVLIVFYPVFFGPEGDQKPYESVSLRNALWWFLIVIPLLVRLLCAAIRQSLPMED